MQQIRFQLLIVALFSNMQCLPLIEQQFDARFQIPKILASYPSSTEIFQEDNNELWVLFDQEMHTGHTQSAFRLYQRDTGRDFTEGRFRWINSRIFFRPIYSLPQGVFLEMTIDQNAESANGVNLAENYQVHFILGEELTEPFTLLDYSFLDKDLNPLTSEFIHALDPSNGQTNAQKIIRIELIFNKAVDLSSLELGINRQSGISYTVLPIADNRVHLLLLETLRANRYQIILTENLLSTEGQILEDEIAIILDLIIEQTSPPKIQSITAQQNNPISNLIENITLDENQLNLAIEKDANIKICFDQRMDRSTTESAIGYSSQSSQRSTLRTQYWDDNEQCLTIEQTLPSDEIIQLQISSDAQNIHLQNLTKDYNFSYRTNGTFSQIPQLISVSQVLADQTGGVAGAEPMVASNNGSWLSQKVNNTGTLALTHLIDDDPTSGHDPLIYLLMEWNTNLEITSVIEQIFMNKVLDLSSTSFAIYDVERHRNNHLLVKIRINNLEVGAINKSPFWTIGFASDVRDEYKNRTTDTIRWYFQY